MNCWRAFTAAALSFCLVVGLAAPAAAAVADVGAIEDYDGWTAGNPQTLINSSSDNFYLMLMNGSSGVRDQRVYGSTEIPDFSSKYTYDCMNTIVSSTSASIVAGNTYKMSVNYFAQAIGASSKLETFLIGGADVLALKTSAKSYGYFYIDVIFKARKSTQFEMYAYISVPQQTNPWGIEFMGNTITQISEPVEAEKTVEEWLQDIFNTIKSGVTGEGGADVTSPEIDAGITDATDYQIQIDQFQDTVIGDFNSGLAGLDLDSFSFPVGILSAMSWVSGLFMDFFNAAGDLQYLVIFPCLVGLSLMVIGRGSRAMVSSSMKNRSKGDDG